MGGLSHFMPTQTAPVTAHEQASKEDGGELSVMAFAETEKQRINLLTSGNSNGLTPLQVAAKLEDLTRKHQGQFRKLPSTTARRGSMGTAFAKNLTIEISRQVRQH